MHPLLVKPRNMCVQLHSFIGYTRHASQSQEEIQRVKEGQKRADWLGSGRDGGKRQVRRRQRHRESPPQLAPGSTYRSPPSHQLGQFPLLLGLHCTQLFTVEHARQPPWPLSTFLRRPSLRQHRPTRPSRRKKSTTRPGPSSSSAVSSSSRYGHHTTSRSSVYVLSMKHWSRLWQECLWAWSSGWRPGR